MRLDDPARPFASPGVRALLLDGGYVPHLTCIPVSSSETKVMVGLRDYESDALYSYIYRSVVLSNLQVLAMLTSYYEDPEATLKFHFNWEPQAVNKKLNLPRYAPVPPAFDLKDAFDLL